MPETAYSILVIDDEDRVRELVLEYLNEFEEFELRGAASGEQALALLKQRPAQLCLVDLRLPGIDGTEFIERAAQAKLCPRFLIHTGSIDFIVPQSLLDKGLSEEDVLLKPVEASELLQRIRLRLQQDQKLSAAKP